MYQFPFRSAAKKEESCKGVACYGMPHMRGWPTYPVRLVFQKKCSQIVFILGMSCRYGKIALSRHTGRTAPRRPTRRISEGSDRDTRYRQPTPQILCVRAVVHRTPDRRGPLRSRSPSVTPRDAACRAAAALLPAATRRTGPQTLSTCARRHTP